MKKIVLNADITLTEGVRTKGSVLCFVEDDVAVHELRAAFNNLQFCEEETIEIGSLPPALLDVATTWAAAQAARKTSAKESTSEPPADGESPPPMKKKGK